MQSSPLEDLKLLANILEAVVTSAAIIMAGIWSYYTFVRGRTFAANVQIKFELKHVSDLVDGKAVAVSISVENIGRTRVEKTACYVTASPIIRSESDLLECKRLDYPLSFTDKSRVYSIFDEHKFLEPGERAVEDVLLYMGASRALKVGVLFTDVRNKTWSSSAIMSTQNVVVGGSNGS